MVFFHPNRQKWYDQHGFHGIDWDMQTQTTIMYVNYVGVVSITFNKITSKFIF